MDSEVHHNQEIGEIGERELAVTDDQADDQNRYCGVLQEKIEYALRAKARHQENQDHGGAHPPQKAVIPETEVRGCGRRGHKHALDNDLGVRRNFHLGETWYSGRFGHED